ncbi:hypothetical protein AB3G45_15395 [Shinella sp. S4-D37]|uniref:hypothetical protein n=1 Tax=Shinella sp. S4-D37 TaxID=3161999 RepID=UPI0034659652
MPLAQKDLDQIAAIRRALNDVAYRMTWATGPAERARLRRRLTVAERALAGKSEQED